MDDTEIHTPEHGPELEIQVAALQRQVFLLLLSLIIVAATVVFYLYYESRVLGYDLETNRPRLAELIHTYDRNKLAIDSFDRQLVDYGAKHPYFEPLLVKYGLVRPAPTQPRP